jgi:cellulose synthase/poly-beta-1,6-N-acetylglucosamine synthase-like glycosyltransferase
VSFLSDVLGWLLVSAFVLAGAAFIVETFLGLLPARPTSGGVNEDLSHPAVVLIPAHNEALIIGQTLSFLKEHLPGDTQILVVADNCSDGTAGAARSNGVEVIERNDPGQRGKGYALEFGRSHLRASPPEAVVVMDADCALDRHSIRRLVDVSVTLQSPAQAKNLLKPDLGAAPMVQISNFAFMIKNHIRQLGASRLGAAAVLTGTGMAFPWAIFDRMTFSAGSVEDLDLTIELIGRGVAPVFVPDATVLSEPAALSAAVMQRDRWERGFLSAARHSALPLFKKFLRERKLPLLWLSLHLLTPPLALLMVFASLSTFLLALLHTFAGMSPAPLFAQAGLLLTIAVLVGGGWAMKGRDYVSLATLFKIPLYIFWKLPIYARMLSGAERGWNRTDRTKG